MVSPISGQGLQRVKAAMAAVSARRMRGPKEIGITKTCDFSSFFSSSVKPPSGPTKTAEGALRL